MKRLLKLGAILMALMLVAAACGGGGGEGEEEDGPEAAPTDLTDVGEGEGIAETTREDFETGGTLKMALLGDVSAAFDPQKEYYSVTWEFYRCCLLRTLMSYNGLSAGEGGNDPVPDLAAEEPTVSDDELTWTFKLKEGINYAPPFEDQEIVADDFINALERTACAECASGGYSFYYSVIEGFAEFQEGEADTISGLNAPDDHTLEVTVTVPTGDLPFRFAMPTTAPIPRGAEEGHEKDYGRYLVSSGPYMFEGSEDLDFDAPPKEQEPVAGYDPGRSIVLVRNPSWEAETDLLRPALVDGIETTIGGTEQDLSNKVEAGELDILYDGVPPADQIRKYQTNPDLEEHLNVNPSDGVRYISFNLAEPPFDDLAVRKAVNLAIDKDGLRRLRGGVLFGELAGHIIVDGLLGGKLADFDPYETANGQGDVDLAKDAMKESTYDTNGDGVCDDPVCDNVLAVNDEASPYDKYNPLIAENLEPLGITLDIKSFERTTMYDKCNDPAEHVAICLGPGWFKDYADATTFAEPLFGAASIGPDSCCNYSLVGAPADVLKQHKYDVTEVPSIDEKIDECEPLLDQERIDCWAEMDEDLMNDIVPWVPYLFDNNVDITSERIINYRYSSFAGSMALDHVAIAPDLQ